MKKKNSRNNHRRSSKRQKRRKRTTGLLTKRRTPPSKRSRTRTLKWLNDLNSSVKLSLTITIIVIHQGKSNHRSKLESYHSLTPEILLDRMSQIMRTLRKVQYYQCSMWVLSLTLKQHLMHNLVV